MVLAESEPLVKKGTILRGSVILGEEKKVALFSGILPMTWCSWGLALALALLALAGLPVC